jgi:hypothetical protein
MSLAHYPGLNSSLGVNMTNFWPGDGNITSYHDKLCYGNITLCFDSALYCTLKTCDVTTLGQQDYTPTRANLLFAALFVLCALLQFIFGIWKRTWGFMVATIFGLALETVGYVARAAMHNNPFNNNLFLINIVALTIAPALLSGAIYLCLARIIVVYGEHLSYFKPRTYTIVFCSCDFISLLLQAIGGAFAAGSSKLSTVSLLSSITHHLTG